MHLPNIGGLSNISGLLNRSFFDFYEHVFLIGEFNCIFVR